jgi:fructose-1,6-bisphosphatase
MSDKHFQKYIEEQSKFLKELESKQTAFFKKIEARLSKLENSGHVKKEVKKELKDPLSTPKYKNRSGEQRKVLEKLSNETLQKIVEDWPKFYDKYNLF